MIFNNKYNNNMARYQFKINITPNHQMIKIRLEGNKNTILEIGEMMSLIRKF